MSIRRNVDFSIEVFPPKTLEGFFNLDQVCQELNNLKPKYFSVTFGAGGSAQPKTQQVVQQLVQRHIRATPHISCVHMTHERLRQILENYIQLGIQRLVVIQGDLPAEESTLDTEFNYANELVAEIRRLTGDRFHITVAAYPEYHPRAQNPTIDLINFKRKIDAGAHSAITQFFFNSDAYFRFLECCHKLNINIPIIPGIMPIHDYQKLNRFAAACGAEIPLWLRKRLESHVDDPTSIKELGIEIVTKLCERLLTDGADSLHFYALNQIEPTSIIIKNLLGLRHETLIEKAQPLFSPADLEESILLARAN